MSETCSKCVLGPLVPGHPMTVTDRTAATEQEFRDRIAPFETADPAPESWDGIRTGPGGCHAALIVRGEHFWCDSKAPHTGWPHGSTAAETIWRGAGPTEDPAAAVAAYRATQDGGACGDLSPGINFGGDEDAERLMCELPFGHGGAHQHDNGDGLPPTRWIAAQDGGAGDCFETCQGHPR